MINHIIDKAFDFAYICSYFVGTGVIASSMLWFGLKCDKTREHVKNFFNLDD